MTASKICPLVNPLCPDDLCVLPGGHLGEHQLETMVEPGPVSQIMFLMPQGTQRQTLIAAGDAYWDDVPKSGLAL